ncbi:MAG: LPS assembly protein LptD [Proteobacteria bacterium]|nr:LPS assembly protein LptD [Pseudomonadota bacterium]
MRRALLASAFAAWLASGTAAAADRCPAPAPPPDLGPPPADPTSVDVTTRGAEVLPEGRANLAGPVVVRQGNRTLTAQDARYDAATQAFDVKGDVVFRSPDMKLSGESATWQPDGGGRFLSAQFELPSRPARGRADAIALAADGKLELDHVEYTACPAGRPDWLMRARRIRIDQAAQQGVGRDVELDFKGVPILYFPVISFPVGDARQSGFLFPSIGTSNRNGFELGVPYYWNLAPNYDATLTPGYLSKRGATLGTDFRFLTEGSRGEFQSDWVPSDASAHRDRSWLRFDERSNLSDRLRFDTNLAYASDSNYFSDFGLGPEGTSVTYLQRIARLTYLDDHWRAVALAEQFQTIDQAVAAGDRPYSRAPQLSVRGLWDDGHGPGLELDADAVDFVRDTGVEGFRYELAPLASYAWRTPGAYLVPAVGFRTIRYSLKNAPAGTDTTPAVSAPIATLDAGLNFERTAGSRLQTLEPRVVYTYIPYRNQDSLPVFDTGVPDLNWVQLFRTDRYVGGDRIGDANQLAMGATSRLVDTNSGHQLLSATLGQIYYFSTPRVTLPNEPAPVGNTSDFVGQLDVTAYRHWNVQLGEEWNPHDQNSALSEIRIQYHPAGDQVANIGYRFRRGLLEQVEGSVAWPVSDAWNVYAKHVYSLRDHAALDSFAGFEYRACCWRLRLVGRRYVNSQAGTRDTSISLQLELNGLSSVGERAGAFLEHSIRGYSATPGAIGSE